MTRRRLTQTQARAVIDAAVIKKAPDWADTHAWHVTSGDLVLVIITPSYGGTGSTGRNGWKWRLPNHAAASSTPEATREKAVVAGLAAWRRQAAN